jgi:hypothetical protein
LLLSGMLTIALGSRRGALFPAIPVSNVAIGSLQEIRSKQTLDRLAALVAPEAVVMRDAVDRRVPVDQVVVGDLMRAAMATRWSPTAWSCQRTGWPKRGQPDQRVQVGGAGSGGAGVVRLVRG